MKAQSPFMVIVAMVTVESANNCRQVHGPGITVIAQALVANLGCITSIAAAMPTRMRLTSGRK